MSTNLWMALIATVNVSLSLMGVFYSWWSSRQRATQREMDVLRKMVSEVETKRAASVGELRDKIVRVEAEVENLPNHHQMADLTENIQEVRGDVGGVRDMLGMLGLRIERIDNYLMNEKGSRT